MRALAAKLLRRQIAPSPQRTTTSDAGSYVKGLAWCLDAYVEGYVEDGSYRYLPRVRAEIKIASSSTPSTRRLLDGVAMPDLTARPSQDGRVIAEK